jgi:O-antigen/teichoic acid export membrane protein
MIKKLFTHTFLYAIGPQIPKLANIIVLPLITPFLTSADYGIYGTVLAYSSLFGGVKTLGIDVLLINSFFKKNAWREYWGRYLSFLYLFGLFFGIIYFFGLYFLMPSEVGDKTIYVCLLIVVPSLFFDLLNTFGGRYFQLSKKPRYIAIVVGSVGFITVCLNYYTIAEMRLGYMGWFISTAIGTFIMFLWYLILLIKKARLRLRFTLNVSFWVRALKVSLPTIPHKYSSYLLNSSDRLVLDQLQVPVKQNGIYNLAYIFGGYMDILGNGVGMAVGPLITKQYSKKTNEAENQVRELVFFLMFMFITLCTLLSLWVKEIFYLLIKNDALQDAYPIAIIVIMGYSYRPLYWGGINKLIFYEFTKKLWRVTFIGGLINVLLNLIFIPKYGIYAAAISTLVSLWYLAIAPYQIKEYKRIMVVNFYPVFWMLSTVIITVLVFYLRDVEVGVKLIVSFFVISSFALYFLWRKSKLKVIEY